MPKQTGNLAALLRASAESRRYPFVERAAFWEERLALHFNDLQTLLGAPPGSDMLTLPPRAKLEVQPANGVRTVDARTEEICKASAGEIAARIKSGDVSPVEVAKAHLERAFSRDHLKAFITLRPDTVIKEAQALEARIAKGEDVGTARRRAGRRQGSHVRQRLSADVGHQGERGQRIRSRRRCRGEAAAGRRHHHRDGESTRACVRCDQCQRAFRRRAKSDHHRGTFPAVRAAAPVQPSPRASQRSRWAPTPAARFASRLRVARQSDSSPRTMQ